MQVDEDEKPADEEGGVVRVAVALVAAIVAGLITLFAVVSVILAIEDTSTLTTQFIVGYSLIGAAIGAASGWFAPSTVSASVVAFVVSLLLYSDIPEDWSRAIPQMLGTLVAAGVMVFVIRWLRARPARDETQRLR
ncbi:hypothetical protein [Janibacter corallicola]|uniref:hypothetical protein n=1 Tax=Janibacter corallicola TaxID=415212 RepID=UPI00082A94F5|nr:hypothetical protein [Janibacter corallicola]